jgi:hypothetical protein
LTCTLASTSAGQVNPQEPAYNNANGSVDRSELVFVPTRSAVRKWDTPVSFDQTDIDSSVDLSISHVVVCDKDTDEITRLVFEVPELACAPTRRPICQHRSTKTVSIVSRRHTFRLLFYQPYLAYQASSTNLGSRHRDRRGVGKAGKSHENSKKNSTRKHFSDR